MKMIKKLIAIVMLLALTGVTLNGCSTIKGAGKDVQSIGRGIERASDDVRN